MYLPAGKVISKTRNIIEALDGRGNAFSILFSFFFILFFASQKLKLTCYISLFDFRGNLFWASEFNGPKIEATSKLT